MVDGGWWILDCKWWILDCGWWMVDPVELDSISMDLNKIIALTLYNWKLSHCGWIVHFYWSFCRTFLSWDWSSRILSCDVVILVGCSAECCVNSHAICVELIWRFSTVWWISIGLFIVWWFIFWMHRANVRQAPPSSVSSFRPKYPPYLASAAEARRLSSCDHFQIKRHVCHQIICLSLPKLQTLTIPLFHPTNIFRGRIVMFVAILLPSIIHVALETSCISIACLPNDKNHCLRDVHSLLLTGGNSDPY